VAGTYAKIDASDQIERACRRALELAPSNKAAFVLLAELLGRRGDLKELSDLFEGRIGQVDDPEELTRLLMVQSDLLRQLGENDASASSLETVLLVDGSNRDALKARSVFDVADGRWNAAVNSLVEWAEQADEDERRLSLWRAAEAILDHGGDPKRAIDVLRLLVAVDDREPDTYRRLVLAARRAGEWDEAAGALAKLAELTPDPEERLCAFRSEGMIRHRLTGDALGASHAWEQVISARPHDIEAISALVELGGDARRERIVDDLSRVVMSQVAQDPTDGEPLRSLLLLRTLGNDPDGALCTLRVIDALGEASDEDLEYLSVLGAQAPAAPGRPLDAKGVSLLVHPDQTGIAEQLLLLLAPILHKVYAADISALRLGRPIKDKGGDLLVAKVRSAAELFGVSGVAIRRSDEPSVTITSVQGTEPTIAVGQQHMGHFSEEETFLLGRSMWHIRAGTSFLANRPETQIRAFHDAATKEGFRDFKPSELRLGVDMLQKELHRSLPRRSRRPLAEIATQMARADEDTLLAWCRGAKASSDRAGLLLSGNVAAALMSIVPGWRGDDRSKRASSLQRVRGSDAARQLLLFAVSNEYLALRREVGLATESW
jgi:tetratricopeptide (TPR) repeat protein